MEYKSHNTEQSSVNPSPTYLKALLGNNPESSSLKSMRPDAIDRHTPLSRPFRKLLVNLHHSIQKKKIYICQGPSIMKREQSSKRSFSLVENWTGRVLTKAERSANPNPEKELHSRTAFSTRSQPRNGAGMALLIRQQALRCALPRELLAACTLSLNSRHFSVLNRPPPNYPGHVPLTRIEKAGLAVGSAIMSLMNPYRGGMSPVN